jgi:hypothetical protein
MSATESTEELNLFEETGIEKLEMLSVVDEYYEELEPVAEQSMFRLKHCELDKSALYELKNADVIEDSGREMGRPTDWQLTETGDSMLELVVDGCGQYYAFSRDAVELFDRHSGLFRGLPSSTEEHFEASEYDLNSSLLKALREAGLLVRVEKNVGAPDVWRLSDDAIRAKSLIFGQ